MVFYVPLSIWGFPSSRVWSYLLMSAAMTASAGLSLLLEFAARRPSAQLILASVVSIGLAAVIGAGVIRHRVLFTTNETATIIDADQIVDFLSTDLHPGDSLVSNAIIQYQLLRRSPQLYRSLAEPKGAAHLVAVVVKSTSANEVCQPEELRALMAAQDTADTRFLAAQIDLTTYQPPQVLAKFLTSTVYSLDRIEK